MWNITPRQLSKFLFYFFYLFGDLKYNLRYSETLIYVSRSWFLKASNAKYIFSSQDFWCTKWKDFLLLKIALVSKKKELHLSISLTSSSPVCVWYLVPSYLNNLLSTVCEIKGLYNGRSLNFLTFIYMNNSFYCLYTSSLV